MTAITKSVEGKDVLMSQESTVYLVDVSGSMLDNLGTYDDQEITKEGALKKALTAMFEARLSYETSDKVSVVTFGGAGWGESMARVVVGLSQVGTGHFTALGYHSAGGTPMYQGIQKATEVLADADGMVRIILISDGEPNDYSPKKGTVKDAILEQVSELSSQYGFIFDTVGVGVPSGSSYDEAFMKEVAKRGSGNFFPIDDVDKLVELMKAGAMERKKYLGSGIKLLGDGLTVQ